ncbi:MAG: DUF2090 domain-containing protein [Candidatus Pacebacteria bacterium]|nr:DUF2090 domain-containing protein [Candidatus Paceibacterota bacterium]
MIKNLFILPFDHRKSFFKEIMGIKGKPGPKDVKQASELKNIIFSGVELALTDFSSKKDFAVLVDEQLGLDVIKKAKKEKIALCLPVEKSGQQDFDFEFGKKFAEHIKKIRPDYVKVLIRYNPDNKKINEKQLEKLAELESFRKKSKYPLVLELLVPATRQNLKTCKTENNYDLKLRPGKTIEAIKEIKEKITPDIWKLEGFEKKDWPSIIKSINKKSRIIILGRGEEQARVEKWLKNASAFKEIIGFAIGRTIFEEPLQLYVKGDLTKKEAALYIGLKFSYFVDFWNKLKNEK